MTSEKRRSLAHHPDFRRLWTGDALGQLGAQLTGFAIPVFAVQTLHATEWEMGLLGAAEFAAFLVLGLPSGAWVDRMRKRRVLITADLARAGVLAVVVAAALAGAASIPLLVAAAAVIGGCTLFFDVAHQSYVPGLVGLDRIVEGNSKLQATGSVAQAAGPALGGVALRVITAPALMAVTVVTYLLSAFWVGRIRQREELPDPATRRGLWTEVGEGLGFVVREPLLRRMVACTSLSNLAGNIGFAVFTIYVLRTLGLPEVELGIIVSAGAIGGILGAVLAERITRVVGEGRIIPLTALLFAPAYAAIPLAATLTAPPAVVLVAGMAVSTFIIVVYNVAQVSFRQRLCPPALLGRMNASVRFIVWGVIPVGSLLGGWFGTALGVVPTLWIAVVGSALAALPVLLSPLIRMRELPTPKLSS
ncbi:MAG: MFS transporter [Actinomycetales bacterium]|nr:MFS transporter [Actinomycetales bacterium]